jgi:hypothetical protein
VTNTCPSYADVARPLTRSFLLITEFCASRQSPVLTRWKLGLTMSEGRFLLHTPPGSTSPADPTVTTLPSFAYTIVLGSRTRYPRYNALSVPSGEGRGEEKLTSRFA